VRVDHVLLRDRQQDLHVLRLGGQIFGRDQRLEIHHHLASREGDVALHLPLHGVGQLLPRHARDFDGAHYQRRLAGDRADDALGANAVLVEELAQSCAKRVGVNDNAVGDRVPRRQADSRVGDDGPATAWAGFDELDAVSPDVEAENYLIRHGCASFLLAGKAG